MVDQIFCCLGHQHQGWVPSPEGDRVLVMFPQRIFPSFTYWAVHYLFSSVLMLFHKSCYSRSFSLTVFLALGKSKLSQIPFLLGGYWQFVKLRGFSRAKDKPHIQTVNTPRPASARHLCMCLIWGSETYDGSQGDYLQREKLSLSLYYLNKRKPQCQVAKLFLLYEV